MLTRTSRSSFHFYVTNNALKSFANLKFTETQLLDISTLQGQLHKEMF